MSPTSFFTLDGDWLVGTSATRGPWDVNACHAGPPTAMIARAFERAVPAQRLTRITVELTRPIPIDGFRIETEVVRAGRSVSATRADLVDRDGEVRVRASGLHVQQGGPHHFPTVDPATPDLDEARPGIFPMRRTVHGQPAFGASVETMYPPGEGPDGGPTTLWLKTLPMLPDEEPSPFQRICPLADTGNANSRNAEPGEVAFVNPDVTVLLHRDPVGEWLGSSAVSYWQPDGIGLADALLFDRMGVVGRALQTLLLRPA